MKQKSILLVEHDKDDEDLIVLAIKKSNVATKVVVARDGVEAFGYLFAACSHAGRAVSDLPQLVLLDLRLPNIDGLEVLRRLRANARTRRVPVVMLTSSQEEEHLLRSYNLRVNSFIRKPVDFNQFVEAVHRIQLYWLVLNESVPA